MNAAGNSGALITDQPQDLLSDKYDDITIDGIMPRPNVNINCAVGLEYLSEVSEISILQENARMRDRRYEGPSEFILLNKSNQQIYKVKEESVFWKREIYRSSRPMRLKIISNNDQEIMVLNRPLKGSGCCWTCCKCCFQNVEVMAPIGKVIGYVHEEKSFLQERFTIKNASEDIMFRMMGPRKSCCFDYEKELNILTRNGQIQVGTITKEFIAPSIALNIKSYKIILNFTVDLDVTSKALLLAATFLMDIMYYEERQFGMKHHYKD